MELYWYIVVIIFVIIKIFFYVCRYRSRQRQRATFLSNSRNAQIVIVGGRGYLHQMCERQSQICEPSTALPPAASFSHLDMPPPYEAVSGEEYLKPPPYSECAHQGDEADAPRPSHQAALIPEGDATSVNEAPPPDTLSPHTEVSQQDVPVSRSESQSESRST